MDWYFFNFELSEQNEPINKYLIQREFKLVKAEFDY